MEWAKLKNLVKQNGDKFVVVENGEPEIVMMSFHEYQKLATHNANVANLYANSANRKDYDYPVDSLVGHLQETEFEPNEVFGSSGLPARLEDIRLEDLPL